MTYMYLKGVQAPYTSKKRFQVTKKALEFGSPDYGLNIVY